MSSLDYLGVAFIVFLLGMHVVALRNEDSIGQVISERDGYRQMLLVQDMRGRR